MAGYSGTPLPKKLGIKPGSRVALPGLPADVKAELRDALAGCLVARDGKGPLDFALIFVRSSSELQKEFASLARKLAPAGMLWVSWPKKSSGVETDLDEGVVREIGLKAGLVDVKVCAVSEFWSGLKFVIRVKDRKARSNRRPRSAGILPAVARACPEPAEGASCLRMWGRDAPTTAAGTAALLFRRANRPQAANRHRMFHVEHICGGLWKLPEFGNIFWALRRVLALSSWPLALSLWLFCLLSWYTPLPLV